MEVFSLEKQCGRVCVDFALPDLPQYTYPPAMGKFMESRILER